MADLGVDRESGLRLCEELFQTGKGQVGLHHYQVRGWTGWHRFITLAMPALAVLTTLAATRQPASDPEITALPVAEIRRLLNALVTQPLPPAHHALVDLATNIPSPSQTGPNDDDPAELGLQRMVAASLAAGVAVCNKPARI
ncbi:hypothetical protein [Polymorphospora lycopeni]|uniref:hypothetical protein n=1 Tax=Polymorphospora sp. A560 TaxID=3040203 RepID=UPI0035D48787